MDEVKRTLDSQKIEGRKSIETAKSILELNIYISTILKVLFDKGICTEGEFEKSKQEVKSSDKDYREGMEILDIAEKLNNIKCDLDCSEEDLEYIKTEGKKILSEEDIKNIIDDIKNAKEMASNADKFKQFYDIFFQ